MLLFNRSEQPGNKPIHINGVTNMKAYNGYKNWNHWNVSLWINNDEGLYHLAMECVKSNKSKTRAAQTMLDYLRYTENHSTPDGAKYSISSIRAAMEGM